jgi:pyridoxal phosphate enzyme (YggS family)
VGIRESFFETNAAITNAINESSGKTNSVSIIAATKTWGVGTINEAISAGIKICGENYVQEAEDKIKAIGKKVEWHFIGHLQSNKAKKAVELFDCIQTVDSYKLAEKISNYSKNPKRILIEINIGKEDSKSGVLPEEASNLHSQIKSLPNVRVEGLFCMPPLDGKPENYFRSTYILAKKLGLNELSMGTSHDYVSAIKEGSTMVRLGTSIFGERNYKK